MRRYTRGRIQRARALDRGMFVGQGKSARHPDARLSQLSDDKPEVTERRHEPQCTRRILLVEEELQGGPAVIVLMAHPAERNRIGPVANQGICLLG
jgi:hypothetical protein